jgi:hypothetical protein
MSCQPHAGPHYIILGHAHLLLKRSFSKIEWNDMDLIILHFRTIWFATGLGGPQGRSGRNVYEENPCLCRKSNHKVEYYIFSEILWQQSLLNRTWSYAGFRWSPIWIWAKKLVIVIGFRDFPFFVANYETVFKFGNFLLLPVSFPTHCS